MDLQAESRATVAGAVAAKERNALPFPKAQGNALQRKDDIGIGNLYIVKFQHRPLAPFLG